MSLFYQNKNLYLGVLRNVHLGFFTHYLRNLDILGMSVLYKPIGPQATSLTSATILNNKYAS